MPGASIKAVVVNQAALTAKYGPVGQAKIQAALQRLITADAARQLQTVIFDIGSAAEMSQVGASAVLGPKDDRGAKVAVDAICTAHKPDYVMLLDGPDVVPHVELHRVPGVTDNDNVTDSDLPYASPAPFSRQVSAYLAVTRVVGRLPAARGETDPDKLVMLIDASIAHATAPAGPAAYFAITADKWKISTQMSLGSVFGNHNTLFVSPTDAHTGINGGFARGLHFINCHGASNDWRFYGEQAGNFPVAMETPGMSPINVGKGAVVAAECCFGAQLYNYRLSNIQPPICLTYLWKGAAAVMGSTNIAYGPAANNGQADLMAQYFLQNILAGASTGRALLQARQTFVQTQTMSGHINLKTLGQFLLLGDPSLHPMEASEPKTIPAIEGAAAVGMAGAAADAAAAVPKAFSDAIDAEGARRMRRIALDSEGKALASAASRPGRKAAKPLAAVSQFVKAARQSGFKGAAKVYTVTGGEAFKQTAKAFDQPRQVAIVMEQKECRDAEGRDLFTSSRAIVGHILGDAVFMIEETESR
jgi:hypothetical protein